MSAPTNFLAKAPSGAVSTTAIGSATAVYTAPSTASGWVEAIVLVTNTNNTATTISAYVGGTAATNQCGWSGSSIPANGTDTAKFYLAPSEAVYLVAGGSGLNYRISLAEVA